MRRFLLTLAFVGLVGALMTSCSSEKGGNQGNGSGDRAGDDGSVEKRDLLEASGWGTVTGRVVLEGEIPPAKPLNVAGHFDAKHCPVDELKDRTWVVDPETKGVANVVVWLRPPSGKAFPRQPTDRRTWSEHVVIDQPHCMFEPRVAVLYPEYYHPESGKMKPTGQRLIIRNSAEIRHNATLEGSNRQNPKQERMLSGMRPGGTPDEVSLKLKPDDRPIEMTCLLHRWMEGHLWAFDHPYAAVTDAEGRFTIRNVPAGAEISLMAWHEAGKPELPRGGEAITVPDEGVLEREITLHLR